jgi:hypothetical protein
MMLAMTLVKKLEQVIAKHGNWPVEIETEREIVAATSVRFMESDSERGCTIIIKSDGSVL